jgi:glycosyltransferase involved in cell wall biosynthesis
MNIRVAHVTLGTEVGGQEKLLVEFAKHADRSRFALHFFSLTSLGPIAEEIRACGWPVTALELPEGLRPGAIWDLARLFARHKIHVVHTHDERPHIYGGPAAWCVGARCIHTRHSQATRLTPRQQLLMRAVSETSEVFVCISADSARRAIAQGVSRRRVMVLPNGIDLNRFRFHGPTPTGPAVIVGRLAPEKDMGTLIEAVKIVRAHCPDFRLEIAGDGPCRESWEKQAAPLGDAVRFLGVVRDVPGLLRRARLFVLSSVTEGISLTLLEAMACGLPIVATRVGGNPEVVSDPQTGRLIPAQNPPALASALVEFWTQPQLCARLGRSGRQRVEARFDIHQMVAAYERLYVDEMPRRYCRSEFLCALESSMEI